MTSFRMCTLALALHACASSPGQLDRDRAKAMLREVAADVKDGYYDAHFHGLDWDAEVAKTRARIDQTTSLSQGMSLIAELLSSLGDSHTFFLTPPLDHRTEYGFRFQMIGERCLITNVRPGSDAEAKGLEPGNELLAIDNFRVARASLWRFDYVYHQLRPQPGMHLSLKDFRGADLELDIVASTSHFVGGGPAGSANSNDLTRMAEDESHQMGGAYRELGGKLMVLKLREFFFDEASLRKFVGKMQRRTGLVLDLRGNPGGGVEELKLFIGALFGSETKIGDSLGREKTTPMLTEAYEEPFKGKLVVLVDSKSGSSAEVLARVVQLEGRGTVIGDRTSGSVMSALRHPHQMNLGAKLRLIYGSSVTDADLILKDGKSLEHVGVVPDEVVLPAQEDLRSGEDPALARAVEILGGNLTAAEAGTAFPYEWPAL